MNKYLLYSLILIFCGCQNWLDIKPKTSINEEDLFQTEAGFKDALTGFYIKMGKQNLYGGTLTFQFMDKLARRYDTDASAKPEKVYDFKDENRGQTDGIYSAIYNLIANINNFLAYLEKNRSVIETPDYYELMKGEALGLRGFLYFDLLRMFGPIYAQNSNAEAIPYRTEFNKIPTPVLPANQVMEKILADLLEAQKLLEAVDSKIFDEDPDNQLVNPFLIMRQLRMNVYAVKATLARAYLYRGGIEDKKLALDYAKSVIDSDKFHFHQSTTENKILFREHIFSIYVYELEKVTDGLYNNSSVSDMWYCNSSSLNDIYESSGAGSGDSRLNAYRTIELGKYVTAKYDQKGYQGDYSGKGTIPLIRLPEMYYILAECEPDAKKSVEWLNTVRNARSIIAELQAGDGYDLPYVDGVDSEKSVRINEIMKEYMKEFYAEGQLFLFYKRLFYKRFYRCPLEKGMIAANYIFLLPDSELLFGNNIDKE